MAVRRGYHRINTWRVGKITQKTDSRSYHLNKFLSRIRKPTAGAVGPHTRQLIYPSPLTETTSADECQQSTETCDRLRWTGSPDEVHQGIHQSVQQ